MALITYRVAASLDGFIASLEGGLDWLASFEGRAGDHGYADFYSTVDAVVVGGRTFDACLAHGEWPFAGKRCFVMTKRTRAKTRPEATFTPLDPEEVCRVVDDLGLKRVYLAGGGELAGAFRDAGLIDEYLISHLPTILGDGVPVFGFSSERETLVLVSSRAFPDGVVEARYRRAPR